MKKRIGFGKNAFKIIPKRPTRPAKRTDAIHTGIVFFGSDQHINILKE